MSRIIITLTDEMQAALKRQSRNLKIPIAVLVREAVRNYLADKGELIETEVKWGGYRKCGLISPEDEN
jgi:predicted DNA-binding protein